MESFRYIVIQWVRVSVCGQVNRSDTEYVTQKHKERERKIEKERVRVRWYRDDEKEIKKKTNKSRKKSGQSNSQY